MKYINNPFALLRWSPVAVGSLSVLLLGACSAHAAPAITGLSAAQTTVGLYNKYEATFSVQTSALNLQIPYSATEPSYAAKLKPNEDAANGVTVNALLLPPGQTDWGNAEVWPCYYQQDYDGSYNPTGQAEWHLRFAPTQLGQWSYEIQVTDSSGSAVSAPQSFACDSSTNPGFISVSPTDSRYFQYSNGSPFLAGGVNVPASLSDMASTVQELSAAHATGLMRFWINGPGGGGLGVIGGFADNSLSNIWVPANNPEQDGLTTEDAHTGRFSYAIYNGASGLSANAPLQPNISYRISFWVKAVGVNPGTGIKLSRYDGGDQVWPLDVSGAWQECTGIIPASGNPATSNSFNINMTGSNEGHILLDDVSVADPNTGVNILGDDGGFEWQCSYDQRASAMLDSVVNECEANGQYLKLVCFSKKDQAFSSINVDGSDSGQLENPNTALGGSTAANSNTAVQLLQSYGARYLMARWGYATAVQSFEYANEIDDFNGIQYAGAESFCRDVHQFGAEGHRLASCSTTDNSSGPTYDPNFYENASLFPDIDYADYHFYPSNDPGYGPYLPYDDVPNCYNCRGFERSTTGGPNGLGEITCDASNPDNAPSDPNNSMDLLDVYRVKGQGTWTIKFWYKTSSDVQFGPGSWYITGGDGVDLYTYSGNVQVNLPWNETPDAPVTTWHEYTATFKVTDNNAASFYLRLRGDTVAGSVSFSDVRLYNPSGQLWTRVTFNEPQWNDDSASLVQYLGLSKESYSGIPAIGKPIVLGECDLFDMENQIHQDSNGVFARQAAYAQAVGASAMIPVWWSDLGGWIGSNGFWKYQGGAQAFLAGTPLDNGQFRDLGATASPTLRVIGQLDAQDGLGVMWVQNAGTVGDGSDAANWFNLTENASIVSPVSGTIVVPGLANGTYTVVYWNTQTGQAIATSSFAAQNGQLSVPVNNLAADEAIKFSPATPASGAVQTSAAHLTLQLAAGSTKLSAGQTVTYTLHYVNDGGATALSVSVPWAVPPHLTYVSSSGGTYNAATNTVTWSLGDIPAGASGALTLTAKAK